MRFVFLWLCVILFSDVVYGESDRDSLKVRLGAPRLNTGAPVLLTDSIPGAFIERLDELYSKWYVNRLGEGDYVDSVYLTEMVTGPSVPDSVYLQRLDRLNSAIKLSYNDIVRNYIELYTVRRRAQVGTMLGLSSYYFPIFEEILDQLGQMPLPPYITHQLEDKNRYQTVYAKHSGSAAAPTAGLHFTPELLEEIKAEGVEIAHVTLHVGLGTFRPVKADDILDHHMHSEFYRIEASEAEKINRAKESGHRVICVGTTSCRTVESAADENGKLKECSGWTEIFIYPGYKFKVLDCLITNFHLPESTLIMLVSALAGREHVLAAYEEAVKERYRFFSFGDAMFIE